MKFRPRFLVCHIDARVDMEVKINLLWETMEDNNDRETINFMVAIYKCTFAICICGCDCHCVLQNHSTNLRKQHKSKSLQTLATLLISLVSTNSELPVVPSEVCQQLIVSEEKTAH